MAKSLGHPSPLLSSVTSGCRVARIPPRPVGGAECSKYHHETQTIKGYGAWSCGGSTRGNGVNTVIATAMFAVRSKVKYRDFEIHRSHT